MRTMTGQYTSADYQLLPEGFPAQLIEGALVREPSPSFGHQRVVLGVARRLEALVGPRRVGIAPLDVAVDELNVFQPDVVVFPEAITDEQTLDERAVPLLVVEVLSPGTAARDRSVKRVRLLELGVGEVWLVEARARLIEVYDQVGYREVPRRASGDTPMASRVLPAFELSPSECLS